MPGQKEMYFVVSRKEKENLVYQVIGRFSI
jgi:hypothetical protein